MNYAKVIGSALQLFPKKIRVRLTDAVSGGEIGSHKIPSEQLPVAFNKPTTITVDNINWQVLHAEPLLAEDFIITKRLSLRVVKEVESHRFMLPYRQPTLTHEMPAVSEDCLFQDLTLDIPAEEWRQLEFLPLASQPAIAEDLQGGHTVAASQTNPLMGYQQQHRRAATSAVMLNIPWEEFCGLLHHPVIGRIALGKAGFVAEGFAVQSDSYTWYGMVTGGFVTRLGLLFFDGVDDEFMQVMEYFKLVFVDWLHGSTLSAEPGETPKSEFVNI